MLHYKLSFQSKNILCNYFIRESRDSLIKTNLDYPPTHIEDVQPGHAPSQYQRIQSSVQAGIGLLQ